jgi:hypothetical protein
MVMKNPIERQKRIARCLAEVSRVSCEGGIGHVEIPDPETGNHITFEIDQNRAREILGGLIDLQISDLWKQIGDGRTLSPCEREAVKLWTASTIAEMQDAECERRAVAHLRRSKFLFVKGDQS